MSPASYRTAPPRAAMLAEPLPTGQGEGDADAVGVGVGVGVPPVTPPPLFARSFACWINDRARLISVWYVARSPAFSAASAAWKCCNAAASSCATVWLPVGGTAHGGGVPSGHVVTV